MLNYCLFLYHYLNKKEEGLELLIENFEDTLNYLELNEKQLSEKANKVFILIQKNILRWRDQFIQETQLEESRNF